MSSSFVTKESVKNIIQTKKSNICLAADVETVQELFNVIEDLGDYICILKIHYDIIIDFYVNLEETIIKLNEYKDKYNFLIWEDRKFADIGMVMVRQVKNHISRWADIISVHSISGLESVKSIDFISIFLIAQLSSKGCLTDSNYIIRSSIISEKLDNIIGIVCQHKIKSDKLMVVPGISIKKSEDGMGQQHNSIDSPSKKFADIYVIGRGILQSNNPKKTIQDLLTKISI
jgi:uridine monophosphate synthetase